MSVDTSSHTHGCEGISSTDGGGHNEKESTADHSIKSDVVVILYGNTIAADDGRSCEFNCYNSVVADVLLLFIAAMISSASALIM